MQDIQLLICKKLDLDPTIILKKPIRGLEGFNIGELILALVYSNSLEEASDILGYSISPVKQCIKSVLVPLFPERHKQFGFGGGSTPWYFLLLSTIQYKKCCQCHTILPYSKFHSNTRNSDSLSSECVGCRVHHEKMRKAVILRRMPSWVNISSLREFYSNCPMGYHVDHIIPLKGELVSGLHVLNNLQYLTVEENLKKSNKFVIE